MAMVWVETPISFNIMEDFVMKEIVILHKAQDFNRLKDKLFILLRRKFQQLNIHQMGVVGILIYYIIVVEIIQLMFQVAKNHFIVL